MHVVWARPARAEYLALLARIRADNHRAALTVAGRLKTTIEQLRRRNTGRRGRVEGTFEKSVTGLPYVVAYTVDAEVLTILRIVHTSRDWPTGGWPNP